ncbi:MAG: hypothetical protein R3C69_14765 [Geminicoccaceae bacterium]
MVLQHVGIGDVVALEHGVVAGEVQVEAGPVALADHVATAALDEAAHSRAAGALGLAVRVAALIGVGIGDAAAELGQPEGLQVPVLAGQEDTRLAGEERDQGEVAIGCQVDEERRLEREPELAVGAERRHEKAGAAFDRGIRMVEEGV